MELSLDYYADQLEEHGFVLVRGLLRPEVALAWADRAREGVRHRVARDHGEVKNLDEGGAYHHGIADAHDTARILPELFGWYEAAASLLTEVCREPVICSPYESSAITLKVYDRPGDRQGWHRDTNPMTALLILTRTDGDYGTHVEDRLGNTFYVRNEPGDLWLMRGRELRHEVPPVPEGKWRVTVPLNYYHPDDTWRPADMDTLIYRDGGVDA